jgi:hypothetical protein
VTDAELEQYEEIGSLTAEVRRPRLLASGNVLEFFVSADSPDCDLSLMLGHSKFHDATVHISVRLIKHPNGKDAKLPAVQGGSVTKPFASIARMLYQRGFFNAPQVRKAIGGQFGPSVNAWSEALAKQLGYVSMGCVPPDVLLDWASKNEIEFLLPHEYHQARKDRDAD